MTSQDICDMKLDNCFVNSYMLNSSFSNIPVYREYYIIYKTHDVKICTFDDTCITIYDDWAIYKYSNSVTNFNEHYAVEHNHASVYTYNISKEKFKRLMLETIANYEKKKLETLELEKQYTIDQLF